MNREHVIGSKTVYHGRILNLRVDTIIDADGNETIREIIEHGNCIAVVAIDNEERVLLVRQFREAVGKTLLEIPAGGIETGEDPTQAMQRELREETGYQADQVQQLGGFYSSPGYSSEYLYLYLATGLKPAPLHAEDTAGIELVRFYLLDIPQLIAAGEIGDAKSIAGLMLTLSQYQSDGHI